MIALSTLALIVPRARTGLIAGFALCFLICVGDYVTPDLLDRDPSFLTCPDLPELCQRAGDFARLQKLSRQRDDPVAFLQAALAAHVPKSS